jgi:2-hydroxy-6-oxonona-2,4-dienedioate hydrolase
MVKSQESNHQRRWDTVGGMRMYTRAWDADPGQHPPAIVLVHGLVVSSRYMVPLGSKLAPDHPVYAPDLPGYGKSETPDRTLELPELADSLAAWMDAVGLDRAVMLGNSFGCNIVVEFALRHPERIERAVLQGPMVDPRQQSAPDQIVRWMVNGTRDSPGMGPIILADYLAAGIRRSLRTFQISRRDYIKDKLPRVRVPTLVVRGARDPIVPQDWVEEVVQLLPNGRLAVIPGIAHTANYSAPLEVARLTRLFIEEGQRGQSEREHQAA